MDTLKSIVALTLAYVGALDKVAGKRDALAVAIRVHFGIAPDADPGVLDTSKMPSSPGRDAIRAAGSAIREALMRPRDADGAGLSRTAANDVLKLAGYRERADRRVKVEGEIDGVPVKGFRQETDEEREATDAARQARRDVEKAMRDGVRDRDAAGFVAALAALAGDDFCESVAGAIIDHFDAKAQPQSEVA